MKIILASGLSQSQDEAVVSLYPNWYFKLLSARATVAIKQAARKPELVTLKAKLEQADDGFVYLKIPDEVIDGIFELIKEDRKSKPPSKKGAHVSVMYADELDEDQKIKEVGEEFEFTLGDVMTVEPEGWDSMERVWFVAIESPELESLRESYGLSKRLNGHDYHITVAVRRKK